MSKPGWQVDIEPPATADDEAFVGLLLRNGKLALRLPLGYHVAPDDSGQSCLGDFSRILARFASDYPDERRSPYRRDGYLRQPEGQGYRAGVGQQPGYSKVGNCLQLIRRLRDPSMMALTRMPGLAGFDPRYIGRNLERASYLADGTPVFDTMWSHAPQLRSMGSDMVGLAAWAALDTIAHLFPKLGRRPADNALVAEWRVLAERFAEDYQLDSEASLYAHTSSDTLSTLQLALETMTRRAPPLHADARGLHQILEHLLNFSLVENSGEIWGLQGFHRVWEAACLEHALSSYGAEAIFTCDAELLKQADARDRKRWQENCHRVFARNGIARRPDLVVRQADGRFLLVDFKYSTAYDDEAVLKRRPRAPQLPRASDKPQDLAAFRQQYKLHQDVANLEAYRWLLMQHELALSDEAQVDIELWVPSEQGARHSCQWLAVSGGETLAGSAFHRISVVYQPTRDIIGPYGDKFRVFG